MDVARTREQDEPPVKRRIPTYVWTFLALVVGLAAGGFFPGPLAACGRRHIDADRVGRRGGAAADPCRAEPGDCDAGAARVGGPASRGRSCCGTCLRRPWPGSSRWWLPPRSFVYRLRRGTRVCGRKRSSCCGDWGRVGPLGRCWRSSRACCWGSSARAHDPTYGVLRRVADAIERAGGSLAYVMLPLILVFGVTLGVRFGARLGLSHYLAMTAYTAGAGAGVVGVLHIRARAPGGAAARGAGAERGTICRPRCSRRAHVRRWRRCP